MQEGATFSPTASATRSATVSSSSTPTSTRFTGGKAGEPEIDLGVTGLYFYRLQAPRLAGWSEEVRSRRYEITDLNKAYLDRGDAQCAPPRARVRLARHRHAGVSVASGPIRLRGRAATGPEHCLPGGNRISARLDRGRGHPPRAAQLRRAATAPISLRLLRSTGQDERTGAALGIDCDVRDVKARYARRVIEEALDGVLHRAVLEPRLRVNEVILQGVSAEAVPEPAAAPRTSCPQRSRTLRCKLALPIRIAIASAISRLCPSKSRGTSPIDAARNRRDPTTPSAGSSSNNRTILRA